MAFIREYFDGDYEIVQYTGGGTVRNRLTGKIIADYTNWYCKEGIHAKTQKEVDHIEKKLGITLKI